MDDVDKKSKFVKRFKNIAISMIVVATAIGLIIIGALTIGALATVAFIGFLLAAIFIIGMLAGTMC